MALPLCEPLPQSRLTLPANVVFLSVSCVSVVTNIAPPCSEKLPLTLQSSIFTMLFVR